MKASEILDRILPRWRSRLPSGFSRMDVDGFVRRHRRTLEGHVGLALARRRAEAGHAPRAPEEFAAYGPVVARERIHDAAPDADVLARLMKRLTAEFATGRYHERSVLSNVGLEYADSRAEAILVRAHGWDPVPLLLDRPALAFAASGEVIAVRDHMGSLEIRPDLRGRLNHLHTDLFRAEEQILHMREEMNLEWDTPERLGRYALAIWAGARAAAALSTTPIRTSP